MMRTATLTIIKTSATCAAYRLTDATGAVVWRNRVYDQPEGHEGARRRLQAWAAQHSYSVKEGQQKKAG